MISAEQLLIRLKTTLRRWTSLCSLKNAEKPPYFQNNLANSQQCRSSMLWLERRLITRRIFITLQRNYLFQFISLSLKEVIPKECPWAGILFILKGYYM